MRLRVPQLVRRATPLDAPKQPGENVYTTLQLSRIVWRIFRAQNVRAILGFFSFIAALVFVVNSLSTDKDLQRQNDAIVSTRTEGRDTTCDSDRRFQINHNDLAIAGGDLPRTVFNDSASRKPPDAAAETRAYGEQQAKRFDDTIVPVRKCDRRSINLFYESHGVFGCETTPVNPKGRCK